MGTLIQAGQLLIAGQGQGQLNQYYGESDTNSTTVTQATAANLSTPYTIPAGEAYAGAAYELSCGGSGTWGSTQQTLKFSPVIDTAFSALPFIAAAALSASAAFAWAALMEITCSDGVSGWWGSLRVTLQETANGVNPGTPADNSIPLAGSNTSVHTALVSSPVTVVLQAQWGSITGSPTITTSWTKFKKVA